MESTLRRHFRDLPKSVSDLKDDPFRSLAGEPRRAGGFAKDITPFGEFLWADFLRRKISRKNVVDNFERAMEKGLGFARSASRERVKKELPRPRCATARLFR